MAIRKVFYTLTAAAFVGSLYYDVNNVPNLQGGTWFARLHFLTMLNFVSLLLLHVRS